MHRLHGGSALRANAGTLRPSGARRRGLDGGRRRRPGVDQPPRPGAALALRGADAELASSPRDVVTPAVADASPCCDRCCRVPPSPTGRAGSTPGALEEQSRRSSCTITFASETRSCSACGATATSSRSLASCRLWPPNALGFRHPNQLGFDQWIEAVAPWWMEEVLPGITTNI